MSVRKIRQPFHGGRSAHRSEATRGASCQSITVAVFLILELLLHQHLLHIGAALLMAGGHMSAPRLIFPDGFMNPSVRSDCSTTLHRPGYCSAADSP